MYYNLKLVIRNIRRNLASSTIKIIGLAIGLSGFYLSISLMLQEHGFDRSFKNHEQIYRIINFENESSFAATPGPLSVTLLQEFPEVESSTNISRPQKRTVEYQEDFINIDRVSYTTPDFFNVFSFNFIEGNTEEALENNWDVVLTKETAHRLFGDESALGKLISIEGRSMSVKGVIENLVPDIHFHFDMLICLNDNSEMGWNGHTHYTYVSLKENTDPYLLETKFPGFIKKYVSENQNGVNSGLTKSSQIEYKLQPITSIHLTSNLQDEIETNGNIKRLNLVVLTSLLVLLLACINIINLKTVHDNKFLKEVRVQHILGSEKKHLIFQVITESIVISFFAMVLAIIFFGIFKSHLQLFYGNDIIVNIWQQPIFILIIILSPLIIGFLIGIFSALFLASLNTLSINPFQTVQIRKTNGIRRSLICFQFVVSIILIICSLIIYNQRQFLIKTTPGLNKSNLLVIDNVRHPLPENQVEQFKASLKKYPQIENVAISQIYLTQEICNGIFAPEGTNEKFNLKYDRIDHDFLNTYNIQLFEGRNFSEDRQNDISKILINKSAAQKLGWKKSLHKTIYYNGKPFQVVGVLNDFMLNSLHSKIEPFLFFYLNNDIPKWCYISVKIRNENSKEVLKIINDEWKSKTDAPIKYAFMDDTIRSLYSNEQKLSKVFILLTILGIITSNLGLFGLVLFINKQRTKEVGIRKVNGAKISEVMNMLNKDFVKWVVIAFVIATPIAYYAMNKWLENFAYKTNLSWWIFALAGLLALGIALLTVSWQSWRAATRNPVEALRYE